MKRKADKVTIIAELYPQHGGDIDALKTMMLQCKMGGADMVKIQLYKSQDLFGDDRKEFAECDGYDLESLNKYAQTLVIPLFASVFSPFMVTLCEKMDVPCYKIASRTLNDREVVESAIDTGKTVFISNGNDPYIFPYMAKNVKYFYCVPKYPTLLSDVSLPDFNDSPFVGYSDHAPGLTAAFAAIVKGAKYVEKHFTLSKNLQCNDAKAHFGSMDMDELRRLRAFCDEFVLMP